MPGARCAAAHPPRPRGTGGLGLPTQLTRPQRLGHRGPEGGDIMPACSPPSPVSPVCPQLLSHTALTPPRHSGARLEAPPSRAQPQQRNLKPCSNKGVLEGEAGPLRTRATGPCSAAVRPGPSRGPRSWCAAPKNRQRGTSPRPAQQPCPRAPGDGSVPQQRQSPTSRRASGVSPDSARSTSPTAPQGGRRSPGHAGNASDRARTSKLRRFLRSSSVTVLPPLDTEGATAAQPTWFV